MRQAVTLAEFGKPACYAVRVHRFSVFLRKQESLIVIILPQPQPFRVLPCPVLPKELHRFRWQRNPTIRSRGFGRILIYADIRRVKNVVADMDAVSRKVNGIPFQPQHFTAPRPSN